MSALRASVSRLIGRWFTKIPFSREILESLQHNPGSVLITQSDSWVMEGLVRSLCAKAGLPPPIYLSKAKHLDPQKPTVTWYSLNDNRHLEQLKPLYAQGKLFIVSCFALRGPIKSRPRYALSILDEVQLLFRRRFLHVSVDRLSIADSESVSTATTSLSDKRFVRRIRVAFYLVLKQVRGSPIHARSIQSRILFSGPEFEREIRLVAQKLGCSESSARRKAEKLYYQISANPRPIWYAILAWVSRCITSRLFNQVRVLGLDTLRSLVRRKTVVLVPMHRSHFDYILVGSELYHAELNPPLVAAGFNLCFFPAGFLIRSVGGYFVKRDARHDRIHALVLRRYVTYLLQRGHLQEFFIEGGRSRSGKMMPPKLGLLNIIVDAHRKGLRRDIVFVPVSITYESVIEDKVFGRENSGESKERENFWALLKARNIFGSKYGEVVLDFGDPLSLEEIESELSTAGELVDRSTLVREIGFRLVRKIRDRVIPSLKGMACLSLMTTQGYAATEEQLANTIRNYCRLLPQNFGTQALQHFLSGNTKLLAEVADQKVIVKEDLAGRSVYYIPGNRRFTADFYRNSCAHNFLLPGMVGLLRIADIPANIENIARIRYLFSQEWLLDESREALSAELEELRQRNVLELKDDVYVLQSESLLPLAQLLLAPLESLIWVHEHLAQNEPGSSEQLPALLRSMQITYKLGLRLGAVSRTEGGSQSSLSGALDAMGERELVEFRETGQKRPEVRPLGSGSEELTTLRRLVAALRRHLFESQLQTAADGTIHVEEQPRSPTSGAHRIH